MNNVYDLFLFCSIAGTERKQNVSGVLGLILNNTNDRWMALAHGRATYASLIAKPSHDRFVLLWLCARVRRA